MAPPGCNLNPGLAISLTSRNANIKLLAQPTSGGMASEGHETACLMIHNPWEMECLLT